MRTFINLYTKPWHDSDYFGTAADIFPAYPNANTEEKKKAEIG